MKKSPLSFYFLTVLTALLPWSIYADTVTLVSGEKVEGKISRETDTEITLEVKVSASISDERVIKKAEIKNVEKASPEDLAFLEIKNIKINPQSSLRPENYSSAIASLESFKAKFPSSTRLQSINELLTALQDEKKRVDTGEMKFQGKWLSAKEVATRKVQIGGMQLFETMKSQVSNQDFIGALNSLDSIERLYSDSRIYPDAVDLAIQVINNLQKQVAERVKINAYNETQFKRSLELTKPEDVPRLKAARKREDALAINAIDQARKAGAKWTPFIPRNKESINSLQGIIPIEQARLIALPVRKMHASVGLTDDAQTAFSSGRFPDALALIDQALLAWPINEDAIRLKKQIDTEKNKPAQTQDQAKAQGANAVKKPQATPTPTSVAADETEKPFYMTVQGAILITAGTILVIGGLTMSGRRKKSQTPVKKGK